MWSRSSSGCERTSFDEIPTVPSPRSRKSRAIAPSSCSTWRTYGQWLQTNATSSAREAAKSSSETVRPSVAGSVKSGAAMPSSVLGADVAIVDLLSTGSGRLGDLHVVGLGTGLVGGE